ncbi:MAG: hypothetical protein K5650_00440 [Bacteroidales bacterium]|nr:hypothetical protein [Bacteroidales bacterium]
MHWIYLTVATLFEMGWPLGFKLASLHHDRMALWLAVSALSMALSGVFLYLAQKAIPISTAYIIWTGIGAVGTFVIGLLMFGDSASFWRIFFATMILIGIVGIEITGSKA